MRDAQKTLSDNKGYSFSIVKSAYLMMLAWKTMCAIDNTFYYLSFYARVTNDLVRFHGNFLIISKGGILG